MKLTIERAALLKALGHVQSAVERRNTIPILSNVLLSAGDGRVDLAATDLDLEIADSAPARVEAPGRITAPAHMLYEIVRESPEGAEVSLAVSAGDPRLQVEAGRARFNLPVLPAGDFPAMTSEGLSAPVSVDTADLARLIDRTRFAISTLETRYYLTGLFVHAAVEAGVQKLRAVAIDGFRLALAEAPLWADLSGAPGVIVPRKAINEARRLMDDAGETVTLEVSAQKIRFGFGRASLTSKVIDGSFPAYERLIPRDNKRVMMLDTAMFAAAVRRVALVSTDQSRPVKLSVTPGRMTLSVRDVDAGQAVEELDVDYDGAPFETGFNARYVLDVAAQIGGAHAELRFAESTGAAPSLDPALVLDPSDAGVQYVLMPLRV